MTGRASCFALACCAWIAAVATAMAAQEPLFSGAFADGTYIAGGKLSEWHDVNAHPKLNGAPILDAAKPLRWLRNESGEPPTAPRAYVEMFGGDRLPCKVLGYLGSDVATSERQPPHLVVKPDVPIDAPDQSVRQQVRIGVRSVRKVVWQRRTNERYTPGTLYYTDGRQVTFERLNWGEGSVSVLLKEGPRRVGFAEIAELHLPRRSPWDVYYETLAVLSPDCKARLMRVETFAGLAATVSLARFQVRAVSGDPGGWFHMLQPAWSLDPLWVRHTHVQSRRFFQPQEVPLSMLEPDRAVQRTSLGRGWNWQSDRNVKGQALRSGGKMFGWGFGVAAYCEMEFELPPAVRSFRSRVGLDEVVGRGGCAKAMLFANKAEGQPLYQTAKHLVGSTEVLDTGTITLTGPGSGQKTLLLVVDPAHADRPAGADPLDIRDMLDWLEPQLDLDLDSLRAEVTKRLDRVVPAWDGWAVVLDSGARLQVASRWDTYDTKDARFRFEALAVNTAPPMPNVPVALPLKFTRRVKLSPRDNYLMLGVDRFCDVTSPSRIEVQVNGKLHAEFDVPERRSGVPLDARLVSMRKFQGAEVTIDVLQIPTNEKSAVDWKSLELVEYTTPTPWAPLTVREAKSAGGATIHQEPESTLFVDGKPVEKDTYTIVTSSEMQGITALRLEVLPDGRLPAGGSGRAGNFYLTDFRVTAAPHDMPDKAEAVELASAASDLSPNDGLVGGAIDTGPQTGWWVNTQQMQPHVAIFSTRQEAGFPGGTIFTFTLNHQLHANHNLGRFRLSATNVSRPVPVDRPGIILPSTAGKPLVIFEDQPELAGLLNQGSGAAALEPADKQKGAAALKITGDGRFNPSLPALAAKIRQRPGPGEYRYLRFAWKKAEGQSICLQVAHDNTFGPAGGKPAKFRYHAGPGPESYGASQLVDAKLPAEWTVVTRDLFADFGEFTFTGIGLSAIDGKHALFDLILLGRNEDDFEVAQ